MLRRILYIFLSIAAVAIGLYPIIYFVIDRHFGLLSTKSSALLNDILWNTTFYGHITFGGLALLIGWLQFNKKLRIKNIKMHRNIGRVYFISVLISGLCSLYIAYYATGGIVSVLGFGCLGIIWLTTTWFAIKAIRNKNIALHQRLMIYSYAACFAAVTLRLWLPLLSNMLNSFETAYPIVSWLCWVPNMLVAYFITKGIKTKKLQTVV